MLAPFFASIFCMATSSAGSAANILIAIANGHEIFGP
jgi:hypothetical protein